MWSKSTICLLHYYYVASLAFPSVLAFAWTWTTLPTATTITRGTCQNKRKPTLTVSLLYQAPAGPKAEGRRRPIRQRGSERSQQPQQPQRPPHTPPSPSGLSSSRTRSSSTASTNNNNNNNNNNKNNNPVAFDGKALTAAQIPNEDAAPLDLEALLEVGDIRCLSDGISFIDSKHNHNSRNTHPPNANTAAWEFHCLDEIYPGLSAVFNRDANFRQALRQAIRSDIFRTTPFYANLSEKAAQVLQSLDSSLEGSWRCPVVTTVLQPCEEKGEHTHSDSTSRSTGLRMTQTTQLLQETFPDDANVLTGDQLMTQLGAWCGPDPSTHFIDIFGVQDRAIHHSWHMDAGIASSSSTTLTSSRTVLWGFPNDNHYTGCGVFSHFVPLLRPCHAPANHARMEPLLFPGSIPEANIVRPIYAPGREIMVFRDVDCLHSAPDVTYRMSLMRFM